MKITRIFEIIFSINSLHCAVAGFYLVYTCLNITNLGVGEISSISVSVAMLLISWFVFKKNLTGMFLAGIMLGLSVEYLTEAYWEYYFNVFIYRDISLYVVMGWGYSFGIFILISNFIFAKLVGKKSPETFDKRIILCDAILGPLWFILHEFIGMNLLHLWKYTECSHWTHVIPIIKYPIEGVVGAILFAAILPTFVRHWEKELQFTRNGWSAQKPGTRNSGL
jgi:hypothetical protein